MARIRTLKFVVEIDLSTEATREDAVEHIHSAVAHWGGQYHPEDPFFGMGDEAVRVKPYRSPPKRKKVA